LGPYVTVRRATHYHQATPDLERKIGESLFPKNASSGFPLARSEVSVVRRALEAGAGISTGNPLLQDERVKIKYA